MPKRNASKKTTAKKTVAKKSTGPKAKATATRADAKIRDPKLRDQVVALRDNKGMAWAEIAEKLGVGVILVQLLYMQANVKPSEKITAKNDTELAKKVRTARDKDKLSWGWIAARAGLPESRVRRLYVEAGGTLEGNRIGKGGRYADGTKPSPAPKAKKTTAKKSTAKSRAAKNAAAAASDAKPKKSGARRRPRRVAKAAAAAE